VVSELTALTCGAVHLGTGAHVRCHGKGRKERITPLRREVRAVLQAWITERAGAPNDPLFPGPRGGHLSRDAIRRVVDRHVATATASCPSLASKTVGPHTLRHSSGFTFAGWVACRRRSPVSPRSRSSRYIVDSEHR
jgi:integrase/recombinase XerD